MRRINLVALLLFSLCSASWAGIADTKHNLADDVRATGDIKAVSEKRICVFCHIPHSAQTGSPLWNRSMPIPPGGYTMYDSIYLQRANYPMPAELGMTESEPGSISRQCLSCHDGTVAIGSVYLLGGTIMGSTQIAMQNVEADGTMPSTAAGFIGTDLSIHHPVGIEYDPSVLIALNSDTRTMELKSVAEVAASDLKLYEYNGKQYVECSSCHDPHTQNTKFLRVSGGNHAQNVVGTCTSCHDKTGWGGSIHQTAGNNYVDTDGAVTARYDTTVVSELGCINCHTPHNGEGIPLLRKVEQNTCFQGAASSVSNAACHGVGGAKDIESVLTRSYKHPVVAIDGVHTGLDYLYGTGVPRDPVGSNGISWDDSKHAVCMDCHNPHQAQAGTHVKDAAQWYPSVGTNLTSESGVLTGVSGVEPTWSSGWTQPTTFTTMESATKEYQICMKCHSYWGLGSATGGVNDSLHYSPSNSSILMTDQAWEFNPNNKSAHPVVMSANDRPEDTTPDHTGEGTYAPRELQPEQLLAPWSTNYGKNVMYCSDCHGSDDELGGDPRGPHGSNLRYILKGENNFWPTKSDNLTLYTTADIKNGTDTGLFCKNCHDVQKPHKDWWNTMANKDYSCVTCHVAVPHGSPVSRMIGYSNFPAPYNYGGNSLFIQKYRKSAYNVIQETDVYVQGGCKNNGCHTVDDSANGAYDPNPFP